MKLRKLEILAPYKTGKISDRPPLNLMKYIQLYLIFTVVFYSIGPVQWKTQNTFITFFLVLTYQLMLLFGYYYQASRPVRSAPNLFCSSEYVADRFVWFALVSLVLNLLLLVRVTSLYGIRSISQTIIMSFTDPTSLYHANVTTTLSSEMYGGSALALINALLSPITFAVIPVGMVLFPKMSTNARIMMIAAVASDVLTSISTGRGEGLMRITVFLISGFLVGGTSNKEKKDKMIKKKAWRVVLSLVVLIGFLFFYSALMENRTLGSYYLPIGSNHIDLYNGFFPILPESIQDLVVYLNIYLTQGYFGMSQSVGLPWKPTFFCGFSSWFRGEVERLLGFDIKARTFMARATEFGWKYGTNWHTAYTWFANDVGWLGVMIIMFLFGRLFNGVYRDAYNNHNPVAIGLFSLLLMFFVYLPANNYLFADSDTFISFFVYLILWGVKVVWREDKA